MSVTEVLALYAAVTGTGALALALLTIRYVRHRPHTDRSGAGRPMPASGPAVGQPAPALDLPAAIEIAGRPRLIAFFSASCKGCRHSLPGFVSYALDFTGGQRREGQRGVGQRGAGEGGAGDGGRPAVIAVIVGDRAAAADLTQRLRPFAVVLHEPEPGDRTTRYGIQVFPRFVLVDAGDRVIAASASVAELPRLDGEQGLRGRAQPGVLGRA